MFALCWEKHEDGEDGFFEELLAKEVSRSVVVVKQNLGALHLLQRFDVAEQIQRPIDDGEVIGYKSAEAILRPVIFSKSITLNQGGLRSFQGSASCCNGDV